MDYELLYFVSILWLLSLGNRSKEGREGGKEGESEEERKFVCVCVCLT